MSGMGWLTESTIYGKREQDKEILPSQNKTALAELKAHVAAKRTEEKLDIQQHLKKGLQKAYNFELDDTVVTRVGGVAGML